MAAEVPGVGSDRPVSQPNIPRGPKGPGGESLGRAGETGVPPLPGRATERPDLSKEKLTYRIFGDSLRALDHVAGRYKNFQTEGIVTSFLTFKHETTPMDALDQRDKDFAREEPATAEELDTLQRTIAVLRARGEFPALEDAEEYDEFLRNERLILSFKRWEENADSPTPPPIPGRRDPTTALIASGATLAVLFTGIVIGASWENDDSPQNGAPDSSLVHPELPDKPEVVDEPDDFLIVSPHETIDITTEDRMTFNSGVSMEEVTLPDGTSGIRFRSHGDAFGFPWQVLSVTPQLIEGQEQGDPILPATSGFVKLDRGDDLEDPLYLEVTELKDQGLPGLYKVTQHHNFPLDVESGDNN